ncbi:carbohydrate ABC transporter permease [Streptomyces sp. WMMB 322]|uniref:carbohydrate ABC transporter permease n=1 Tax=Streptomyces sp. WMMB 322 TaxID=1286821 RepID=UPI000823ACB5|nr:carbohydrate ABC transporter permease [Streptomyces sp. WMMB 322]SCK34528.1 carbohydrate ABC transporter membrane protein 2, CUT1 family (TC 3.A.1.1.-) [Streptomyces sp. WMMB 322]
MSESTKTVRAVLPGTRPRSRARRPNYTLSALTTLAFLVVFVIPFAFIALTAFKGEQEAARLEFSLPGDWQIVENFQAVLETGDYILIIAFINSVILTVASVTLMVVLGAMVAFILQRRTSRTTGPISFLVLSGLIIPPAVVPTIWVLQELGLFKTLFGLILVEVAFHLPFCVLLFRAFIATVPRDLDESAVIDGAGPVRLFFRVIFPLLRPVTVTVIVVQSVNVFNDFVNPLYFLPGEENATVQQTLFNFQSQFESQYNLLFMDILLITIPPLIMFLFFNRQIVAGMTSGAIKG